MPNLDAALERMMRTTLFEPSGRVQIAVPVLGKPSSPPPGATTGEYR